MCLRSVPAGFNSLEGDGSRSGSKPAADMIQRKITAKAKTFFVLLRRSREFVLFFHLSNFKVPFHAALLRTDLQLKVCACVL